MKPTILQPILVVATMLASSVVVVYLMFTFVKYDPLPSDIIQTTPKSHYTPVRIRET